MIAFTVHEPPDPPADRIDRAEALVFVRDGFVLPAAILPPVWFAAKRLWLPLVGYIAIAGALAGLGHLFGLAPGWIALLIGALDLLVGFEADALERFGLEQRGFAMVGTVAGRSTAECERRFFDDWLPSQPVIASVPSSGTAGTLAATAGTITASAPAAELTLWQRFIRGRAR